MKLLPVLILLCLFYNSFAQSTSIINYDEICQYKTDGTGKSLGLKIKINYPCGGQIKDGERPMVIKGFLYGSNLNSGTATIVLSVTQLPTIYSQDEFDKGLTQDTLNDMREEMRKRIGATSSSIRKVKIDNLHTVELEYNFNQESPVGTEYYYGIAYNIYYKDKVITLSYQIGSSSTDNALAIFEKHKMNLKSLAIGTIIISQWE